MSNLSLVLRQSQRSKDYALVVHCSTSLSTAVSNPLGLEMKHEAVHSLVAFLKSLTERTPPGPTAYDEGFDKYPLFNSTVTAKPSSVNHNWDLPPPK